MATNDYINPTSIRPEYDWKPKGFLAGMNYSQDRQRYEDVSSLQDYMMKNQAVKSGAELSEYFSNAPVREAKRGADIASSTATRETIGGIKRNEMEKGSLENELSAKIMGSKIAEAAAKAEMEGDKSQMSQLATGAAIARAFGAAAGNGPGALAGVMQQLQQSKADPRIIEWFKNSRSPQELMQKAQMMTDAFMQANEHYRSVMDANTATNATRLKEAGIQAQAQRDVAEIRQKAKIKSIDQLLQDAMKLKPLERAGAYRQILEDVDATVEQQRKARIGLEEAIKAINITAKTDEQPILGADGKPILPPPIRRQYGEDPGGSNVIDFNSLKR